MSVLYPVRTVRDAWCRSFEVQWGAGRQPRNRFRYQGTAMAGRRSPKLAVNHNGGEFRSGPELITSRRLVITSEV
jgi:hypothetical protein